MKTAQSLAKLLFLTTIFVALSGSAFAQAEAPPLDRQQQGSLNAVPQTTAFYFSTMNHQALLDRFFDSNAWSNLKSTDVSRGMKKAYRRGKSRGYAEYNEDNPFAKYLKGYGESIGSVAFQSVWQIAKEVVENELFVYVDNDAIEFSRAISKFQLSLLEALPEKELRDDEAAKEKFLEAITESFGKNFKDVDCPTIILGARLDEPEEFKGMLELLQSLAEQGMTAIPKDYQWIKKWWQVVDKDGQFMMSLDVNLIDVPLDELLKEIDDPKFAKLIQTFSDAKQLSVALGIVDDLLMLGIASDKAKLLNFGDGPLLVDTPLAKKLRGAIDNGETIVNVAYLSEDAARSMATLQNNTEMWKYSLKTVIRELDSKIEIDREQLTQDAMLLVDELVTDWRKLAPTPGAAIAFSSLQDEGIRMSVMYKSKIKTFDGSKPLKLANHASRNTVALMAYRSAMMAEQYDFVSKWSAKAFNIFRTLSKGNIVQQLTKAAKTSAQNLEGLPEDNFAQLVGGLLDGVEGLFAKFDKVTKEKFLPAIEGQEVGVFVDMVSGPNTWCADMKPSEEPLPLPLPAIVVGHSNAEAVIEAGTRYFEIANEGVLLARKAVEDFASEKVPDELAFEVPPPQRIEDDQDVSFRWNILVDQLRADASLQTGTRISKDWLLMNFHEGQAKRLTSASSDGNLFGPAQTTEPSAFLAFIDNRVLLQGVRQWAGYAATMTDENPFDMSEYDAERDTLQFSETQIREAIDSLWAIAECFKGVSMRTWQAPEGMATEILLKFEDVGP